MGTPMTNRDVSKILREKKIRTSEQAYALGFAAAIVDASTFVIDDAKMDELGAKAHELLMATGFQKPKGNV